MLEVWLALIDGEGGLIEMGKYKYKIIEEVEKELEEIYADEELKALLDYRQSADLDRDSALYNAEQKGIKKRIRGTDKNSGLEQRIRETEENN